MVVEATNFPWPDQMRGANDASSLTNNTIGRFPFIITSSTTPSRKFALLLGFLYLVVLVAKTNAAPLLSSISQTARWNDDHSSNKFPSAVNGKGLSPIQSARRTCTLNNVSKKATAHVSAVLLCSSTLRGGGGSGGSAAGGFFFIPAGWNPLGYKLTLLGEEFLKFDGSLDCDLGRFLASLKAGRRRTKALKASWLEIVRVSKTGQSMRIYRQLDDLILFSLRSGLIN